MSTYEISKSSLLSLKAEILKKQEEVSKAKLENHIKLLNEVKKGPLEFKNKGIENRLANDVVEDENLLRQSRAALEAKSKLYDKLSNEKNTKESNERNRHYLVRFDKKAKKTVAEASDFIENSDEDDVDKYPDSEEEHGNYDDYKPENSDDEWIEYTDFFGRTRTCLKKDLPSMKKKDVGIRPVEDLPSSEPREQEFSHRDDEKSVGGTDNFSESSDLLSGDMRRELLRREWEKDEDLLRNKSNVHYQDILFNEARTHGVGYYGFSKDDEERAKQQEALKKLRQETQQQQKLAQEIKKNRERQLSARVLAAKNRKRARMGLPPITQEEEEEEKSKEVEEEPTPQEKPEEEILKEKKRDVARKMHVRPWDVGKEGVKKHYEYSQEEWVLLQRKKRDRDFAPPRSYYSKELPIEMTQESEKSLFFTSRKKKKPPTEDCQEDTMGPLPRINKRPLNPYKTEEFTNSTTTENFVPELIEDECVDVDEDDQLLQDFQRTQNVLRGAEFAPPPTYEYYGPSSAKKSKMKRNANSMEDSIMEGLKYLREKVEKQTDKIYSDFE